MTPEERRTPMQRWGTCCPFDPECEHSYLDMFEDRGELEAWMNKPLTDEEALRVCDA